VLTSNPVNTSTTRSPDGGAQAAMLRYIFKEQADADARLSRSMNVMFTLFSGYLVSCQLLLTPVSPTSAGGGALGAWRRWRWVAVAAGMC